MNYHSLEIREDRPKLRSWNWRLIPKRLEELARAGVFYDDRMV